MGWSAAHEFDEAQLARDLRDQCVRPDAEPLVELIQLPAVLLVTLGPPYGVTDRDVPFQIRGLSGFRHHLETTGVVVTLHGPN